MGKINHVMIIDDDSSIRMLLEMSLSKVGGYQVSVCESGEQAIEQAEHSSPDLVLLDAYMRGKDGDETLRELRKFANFQTVPIVFVTGEARAKEIEKLKSLGAKDVIVKPIDPMALPEQLEKIMNAS